MNEVLHNLAWQLNVDVRESHAEREASDCDHWNPYLGTRATSEQRAERAERLRLASRRREDAA